jgi:AraC-like DNA-binding protein
VKPRRVEFLRHKYGYELLVDVAWVQDMPTFILDEPHVLTFYELVLITAGTGHVRLDGIRYPVEPDSILLTSPGQVREWGTRGLRALCVFFPASFLDQFTAEPMILHRLPLFHREFDAHIRLAPLDARRLRTRLAALRTELREANADSVRLLAAVVYETLVRLARLRGTAGNLTTDSVVHRFRELVERDFASQHHVGGYARALGVSRGQLTVRCQRVIGQSAKACIQERLVLEARRRLLYTDDTAGRIAYDCGFKDPAYFTRFFRRATGLSPSQFRRAASARTPSALPGDSASWRNGM